MARVSGRWPGEFNRSASLFMDAATEKRRTLFMLKWAPLFLLAAVIGLLFSLRFAPFSALYLSVAVFVGMVWTILILVSWKFETRSFWHWPLFVAAMSLWYFSEWLARDWAFPAGRFGSWVFIQYFSVIFVI